MGMGLDELRSEVAAFGASLDVARLSPTDAERAVRVVSSMVNMLEVARAQLAARAAQGGSWRREGARSAAHQLARQTGSTVGAARDALAAGEQLGALPALSAAAKRGELSAAAGAT
jgi:hypothetical protein